LLKFSVFIIKLYSLIAIVVDDFTVPYFHNRGAKMDYHLLHTGSIKMVAICVLTHKYL